MKFDSIFSFNIRPLFMRSLMKVTVFLIHNNFLLNYDVPVFLLRTFSEQFHIWTLEYASRSSKRQFYKN